MYPAQLRYPDGRVFSFHSFSSSTLGTAELDAGVGYEPENTGEVERMDEGGKHEILVCTHGARDCRCAEKGGSLVDALRHEIGRRDVGARVRIKEIAHVGGHKYALPSEVNRKQD